MDVAPEIVQLGIRLGEVAARNGASAIADKVRLLRAAKQDDATIASLEQIVNELIEDKNELTRIARSYQSELVAQNLTPGDVRYITDQVVPLVEQLAAGSGASGQQLNQLIAVMKPLFSVETVNVLQILGFDFRRAVGEPLTRLVEHLILARVNQPHDAQVEVLKRDQLQMQVALDSEAFARWENFGGHPA